MQKIDYINYKKPTDYIKFSQGDNRIRIITSGAVGYSHGIRTARGYKPLGLCRGDDCPHCKKGVEAKRTWRWIAYDFTDEDVKLLDAGVQVGNGICELAAKLQDDPQNFDIIIHKTGEKRDANYLVTKAKDEKLMSKKDLSAKKRYLISKYFKPKDEGK